MTLARLLQGQILCVRLEFEPPRPFRFMRTECSHWTAVAVASGKDSRNIGHPAMVDAFTPGRSNLTFRADYLLFLPIDDKVVNGVRSFGFGLPGIIGTSRADEGNTTLALTL